jgi:hypothetical protein
LKSSKLDLSNFTINQKYNLKSFFIDQKLITKKKNFSFLFNLTKNFKNGISFGISNNFLFENVLFINTDDEDADVNLWKTIPRLNKFGVAGAYEMDNVVWSGKFKWNGVKKKNNFRCGLTVNRYNDPICFEVFQSKLFF